MSIAPHAISGDFNQAVFDFLKARERFVPRVYSDSKGIPTLGVGYALIVEQGGVFRLRSTLSADLALAGVTVTQADIDLLNNKIAVALNAGNVSLAKSLVPPFRVGENSAAFGTIRVIIVDHQKTEYDTVVVRQFQSGQGKGIRQIDAGDVHVLPE